MSDVKDRAKIAAKEMKLTGWDRWADVITDLLAELMVVEGALRDGVQILEEAATRIEELEAENASAMREASSLAKWLHKKYYAYESPDFRLCDTPAGVMTQIDNMITGIPDIELKQAAQECVDLITGMAVFPYRQTLLGVASTIKDHFKLQEAPK